MTEFDLTDSELQDLEEWGESMDFDCLDIIEELQTEPQAKRQRICNEPGLDLQGQVPITSPVQLNCSGRVSRIMDKEAVNKDGYLATGLFERLLQSVDPYPHLYGEPVMQQFKAKFVTNSALLHHTEKLFFLLRQQIFKLQMKQNEGYESHQLCLDIREECSSMLAYVHTFILRFLDINQSDHRHHPSIGQILVLLLRLKKELDALLAFLGRLSDLPSAAYLRSDVTCALSDTRMPAASHFFHLNLDLMWNCILALCGLLHKEDMKTAENNSGYMKWADMITTIPKGIDYGDFQVRLDNRDVETSVKSGVVSLLWDLVKVAVVQFNKVNESELCKVSPFPCSCVREVWIMLRLLLDNLANKSVEMESFWSIVSAIMTEILNPRATSERVSDSQETVVISKAPEQLNCRDPTSFCWWILSHLAPLYWYNETGVYCQRQKASVPGNWVFAQDLLKSSLTKLKDGHGELQRRSYLRWCLSLSWHWSANTDLILYLWDYFHRRMNDSFHVTGQSLQSVAIDSNSALHWMEQCMSRCREIHSSPLEHEHSFHIFLRIVSSHLVKLLSTGSLQAWKPIKGRFYSKFHKRRMEELNETGLHHFISLFLSLACVAELEDVANKMCSFLDLLDFKIIEPKRRHLIWKGLFAMLLVYKEKIVDLGYLAERLSQEFASATREFSKLSSQDKVRQRQLWDLIGLYLDSTQEVFEHKNRQTLSEAKLLGEGFSYLMSSCRENELRYTLVFVQSILATVRTDDGRGKDTVNEVRVALWGNIFPHVQRLSVDQHVMHNLPTQVADVLAGFALLALDRQPQEKASVQYAVSFTSLVQEFGTKDEVANSLSCRLLCHVLPCGRATEILRSEGLEPSIVRTWFRCMLQLPLSSGLASQLTRFVCKLQEMELIVKLQPGLVTCGNRETALQMFITALGQHYSSLNTFKEMARFREKALLYVGDVLKYSEPVLLNAAPLEHLRLCYHVAGALTRHCPKIIYSKTQPHCLLPRILDQLVIPLLNSKKPTPLPMVQCTKMYLHQFLQGLASLDFRRDDFLRRKIKQIFVRYFHPVNQKYLSASQTGGIPAKHPFLLALKDTFTPNPSAEASDFRQLVVEIIRDTYLNLPQPPVNLTPTLFFLQQLLKKTHSPKQNARNSRLLISPIMGCLVACNNCNAEVPILSSQVTEILQLLTESCIKVPEMNSREELLPSLRDFLYMNLPSFQGRVLKAFETLAVLDPVLVRGLIPAAKQAVTESEQKRGVGTDTELRSALNSLENVLGLQDK